MPADPVSLKMPCPSCGCRVRMLDGRCADCMAELTGACQNCSASTLRFARFCWSCGATLREEAAKKSLSASNRGAIARRPVTVMFCDLVGSTALSIGMDPEDFGDILRACHTLVTDIVVSHDGFAARYMGDGTLAFFGYPQSGEDNAERAIRAGLALLRAIPRVTALGRPMQMRVGIASGVVLVGNIDGGRNPRSLDVAGEVPNLAARLQSVAEPNTILVDDAVRAQAGPLFEFVPLGGIALKGWARLISAWKVVRPAATAIEAAFKSRGPISPLVGRHTESARLAALWRDANAGCSRAVVLVGEMGIGKSRLVGELLRATAGQRCFRRRWFCSRYLQGVVLHPVVREIERSAGIAAEDPPSARRDKLNASLAGLSELDRALIAELIAPGAAPPSVAGLSPNKRRELILDALFDLNRRQTAGQPLLAVFEDYHWADPTSCELLSRAVQQLSEIQGLLIVTVRPGGEPPWIDQPGVERIELDALERADATRLAEAVAAHVMLPPATVAGIVARCDGVPLFIEEVTRAIVEGPAIGTAPVAASGPMPLSIHASLMSRLDSLGAAREAAEVASVIGREFAPGLLAQVMDRSDAALQSDIDQMVASGLVCPGEGGASGFRFKHALIQDAAYDGVLRDRRRVLHGRIARVIRDLAPALAETQPQLLATHFTEAGEVKEAVTWWLAAGTRSLQQSATTEGLEQLSRGLELLRAEPDSLWNRQTEMALLICKAKAHVATSGHASDAVGTSFSRARILSLSLPGMPQQLNVTFGEWSHYVTRGPLTDAARLAEEIRTLAQRSGEQVHAMFGNYTSGMTDTVIGRLGRARSFLEQGIAACAEMSPASYAAPTVGDPKAIMLAYLALIDMSEGKPESCTRNMAAALHAAHETKLPYSIALTLLVRATIEAFIGAPNEGDGHLDALRGFARDRGMAFFVSLEIQLRGWAVARQGDTETGLALLREGLARYRATQSGVWTWTFLRMQAQVLGWTGQTSAGLAVLDEADQAAAVVGSEFEASVRARVRGDLLAQAGQMEPALAALARAETIAVRHGVSLFADQAAEARRQLLGATSNERWPALLAVGAERVSIAS